MTTMLLGSPVLSSMECHWPTGEFANVALEKAANTTVAKKDFIFIG
jgi:hypothetical protein